ncbi:MAG: DUF748 domain-containing protein [Desulfobulbaceae bacterium]|nr:DUF748 domain-containing protein [Desulfobulbaceae bacterium]
MADSALTRIWGGFSRLQKAAVVFCVLFLLYSVFGFLILPAIVASQLEKQLTAALQRQTTVRQVRINPYLLKMEINGFHVEGKQAKEAFISFDSLKVDMQAISVLKRAIVVRSVSLENPFVRLVFNKDQSFNFSDLIPPPSLEKDKQVEKEPAKPLLFSVNNIEINGGKVDFDDRMQGARHLVSALHLAIPFISNISSNVEIFVKPAFDATVNGTPLSMAGATKPFVESRHTELEINFTDIDLTNYLAYLPDNVKFSLTRGLLDLNLTLFFMQHEDGNPAINITGNVAMRDVAVVDRGLNSVLTFPELSIEIDRAHIFRKEFHLAKILLREPEIVIKRLKDGAINLASLVDAGEESDAGNAGNATNGAGKQLFEFKDFFLQGGTVYFTDESLATPFKTTVTPLDAEIHNFSTAQDTAAQYALSLLTQRKEKIEASGTFSTLPLLAASNVVLENIDIAAYSPYYEHVLLADLAADQCDLGATLNYSLENDSLLVSDIGLTIGNLTVTGRDAANKITVPQLVIAASSVDVKERTVILGEVETANATLPLVQRKDGSLSLLDLFAKAAPSSSPSSSEEKEQDAGQDASWSILATSLGITDYTISLRDEVPENPASFLIDQLNLKAENISTNGDDKGRVQLSLRLNKTGRASVNGSVGLSPLALHFDVDVNDVPFKAAQPYIDEKLNLMIGDGAGAITGIFDFSLDNDQPAVSFSGNVSSRKFLSMDSQHAEKIFSWDDLVMRKMSFRINPLRISIGDVSVDGLSANVWLDQEGKLNLSQIAGKSKESGQASAEPESPGEEGELPDIKIKQISILNSRIDFTDSSVSPNFSAALSDIQGHVKGLSSDKDVLAELDISSKLADHSPLIMTGTLHPWQDFFTDITVNLHDMELNSVSPYTVKFIGYPLTKGKLNLDLHYLIEGKKLKSENKAFLNQITLGDFVKNETATSMPVPLAISLLKNRQGEIALDIPVSGELDDPEFSVGAIVFKVIFNLIIKAATSPFALLGSLFPDGGEVQFVRFEAASNMVVAADTEKLQKLAKALYDRPALNVELTGFVDVDKDKKEMSRMRFYRLLQTEKMKDLVKEKTVPNLDDVTIAEDEYEQYLTQAYKEADFERPRNFFGFLKKQPPDFMEKLLYDHIVITNDDLSKLASSRAKAVKDALVDEGPVEAERIFLVEAPLQKSEDDLSGMRVEMVLK